MLVCLKRGYELDYLGADSVTFSLSCDELIICIVHYRFRIL